MSSFFGGVDWDNACKILQRWTVAGCGLPAASVVWAQQDAPRPAAPAVMCRVSNIAETGQTWIDYEDNPLVLSKTVSAVSTGADTLTITAHGLGNGDGPFQFTSTGALPAGIAPLTNYWAIWIDANTIQLADTFQKTGGAMPAGIGNPITPLDITGTGSGTITMSSTADSVTAGQELKEIARCYLRVTLELHCHAAPGVGLNMATSILQRVRTRRMWTSQDQLLDSVNIGLMEVERVRAVAGVRDALLFEPRAYLEVHFCVPAEEIAYLAYIETADLLDQVNNHAMHIGT